MNKRLAKKVTKKREEEEIRNLESQKQEMQQYLADIILRAQEEAKAKTSNRKIKYSDFCERTEKFTEEMYYYLIESWTKHLSICKTEEDVQEALNKIAELEEAFPRFSKKIKK